MYCCADNNFSIEDFTRATAPATPIETKIDPDAVDPGFSDPTVRAWDFVWVETKQ